MNISGLDRFDGVKKHVDSVDSGLSFSLSEIEKLLAHKNRITVNVSGKSGAGKTFFTHKLASLLSEKGVTCSVINTDNYVVRNESSGEHDFTKLSADISASEQLSRVVIVEGLIPFSKESQADYKIFFDSPLVKRIATRFYKEAQSGHRDLGEAMRQLVAGATDNPVLFSKYESVSPDDNTDLLVENSYTLPESPNLRVVGNKFVFSVNGSTVFEMNLEPDQIKGLERNGF